MFRTSLLNRNFRVHRLLLTLACCCLILSTAWATTTVPSVRLNNTTNPSQGQAGTTNLNLTGAGFPTGFTAADATIYFATSCMGSSQATAAANSVKKVLGTTYRVNFTIPAALAVGTYYVWITGNAPAYTSANCSEMKVIPSVTTLSSCVPGASMSVLFGPTDGTVKNTVTAYVPNNAWDYTYGNTVDVVPLEGAATTPSMVSTGLTVNSCSSNSNTLQTVCVDNNQGVYVIKGSSLLASFSSGANTYADFSGGRCMNCGVAMDAVNNIAYINEGYSDGIHSGSAIEGFKLNTLSFTGPFGLYNYVSEDIQIDPGRNLLLTPNENNIFSVVNTSGSPWQEYGQYVGPGEIDSAGEDCTTGIAVSPYEFTGSLFISDLSQATYVNGLPGSISAPYQIVNFPEFNFTNAGASGIAVAPGSHLAVVADEFGGNDFGVVTLPSVSGPGTGIPNFGDYAAAHLPATPDGYQFSQGYDPHTVTAYVSPNTGRVYGLIADWAIGAPSWIAVIDMQALLSAPRTLGTHSVDPTYDLVAHGVVRYVKTY